MCVCLACAGREALVRAHLAKKTWENYSYGKRKILRWLKESGRQRLDVDAFLDFIVDCADAHLCYDVPNFARCWLAVEEKMQLGKQVVSASPKVKMALEGYKRVVVANKRVRTPVRLSRLLALLRARKSDDYKLACLLAYVFLLRVSETMSLLNGHGYVRKTQKGYILFLPKSKADQEAKGVSVFFPNKTIPVTLSPFLSSLLPRLNGQSFLDSTEINAFVHSVLGDNVTFHCFRHGRASDLFDEGLPLSKLMELGRWATKSAVTCYLH